jgi:cobalt/nickel transport system permease protein
LGTEISDVGLLRVLLFAGLCNKPKWVGEVFRRGRGNLEAPLSAGVPQKGGRVHIPDGFINAATSVGAGAVTVGGLSLAVKKAGAALEDRQIPLAGLVAAFVFAAQMINFPVGAGTSGHLIGAVLAAVLVGPWAGAMCLAVVLFTQTLFADGGLSALGLNIFNMSFVAGLGGYCIFLLARRILPSTQGGVTLAAALAAGISVPLAALAFVAEFAIGGEVPVSIGSVTVAMVGVHVLIGIGEAVITGLTVGAVLSVRPDLVWGGAGIVPSLRIDHPQRVAGVLE